MLHQLRYGAGGEEVNEEKQVVRCEMQNMDILFYRVVLKISRNQSFKKIIKKPTDFCQLCFQINLKVFP